VAPQGLGSSLASKTPVPCHLRCLRDGVANAVLLGAPTLSQRRCSKRCFASGASAGPPFGAGVWLLSGIQIPVPCPPRCPCPLRCLTDGVANGPLRCLTDGVANAVLLAAPPRALPSAQRLGSCLHPNSCTPDFIDSLPPPLGWVRGWVSLRGLLGGCGCDGSVPHRERGCGCVQVGTERER
jgi:hypothetical protein